MSRSDPDGEPLHLAIEFVFFLAQPCGEENQESLEEIEICVSIARVISEENLPNPPNLN